MALLSPAKTLDMEAAHVSLSLVNSRTRLTSGTRQLAAHLREFSPKRLSTLMKVSDNLARQNADRWQGFGRRGNGKGPAAICFRGDVYQGLEAWTMKAAALQWAQQRLRILSGLYGLLRPLDTIQPYRLEMGTRLKTDRGGDLYSFWGDQIHTLLGQDIAACQANALVNLASEEYSKAAQLKRFEVPVIAVKFLQVDRGQAKFISYYGKRARGLMARWMADHRPKTCADLAHFDSDGYRFDKSGSSATTLIFTRPKPAPVSAKAK
ncbi:MAG: peroxide stress protein YaaA [Planctomycetota bacterium]|nr:peroxide stress protein YaaA [Planctomycetota bacterium]